MLIWRLRPEIVRCGGGVAYPGLASANQACLTHVAHISCGTRSTLCEAKGSTHLRLANGLMFSWVLEHRHQSETSPTRRNSAFKSQLGIQLASYSPRARNSTVTTDDDFDVWRHRMVLYPFSDHRRLSGCEAAGRAICRLCQQHHWLQSSPRWPGRAHRSESR